MTQKMIFAADDSLPHAPLPTVARPFDPMGNVDLSVTDESAAAELPAAGSTMIVRNYGPKRVFIARGGEDVEAALTDYPVEPETYDYVYRDPAVHTHLAAICADGETAELSINCGEGGA